LSKFIAIKTSDRRKTSLVRCKRSLDAFNLAKGDKLTPVQRQTSPSQISSCLIYKKKRAGETNPLKE